MAARRKPTPPWCRAWTSISAECCRRSTRAVSPGNTIVVFTSDNGGERFSKTWPFTGMKKELLEGGLRIPAIVRWPGRIAAGSVSEQVMVTMDWVPTLLAAAGTSPDAAYPSDGEDLGPIADRPRGAASAQAVLALQGWIAARHPRRRLEISADSRQRVSLRRRPVSSTRPTLRASRSAPSAATSPRTPVARTA